MTTLPDKPLLRVDEVAEYFDVTERTIRLWIVHGLLVAECFKRDEAHRGVLRITRESVIGFRLRSRVAQ